MTHKPVARRFVKALTSAVLAVLASAPRAGFSDAPPSTSAHGAPPSYHVGYTGRTWERDYGVIDGYCTIQAVGVTVGGVPAGAVGSTVGSGDGRAAAVLAGSVFGGLLEAQSGHDIDDADRACMGHALELTPDGRAVRWANPKTGASYVI